MNYLFLALLVSFSLSAMEPAVIKMEGEEANERTTLLPPQPIAMSEQSKTQNSIIYDGSVRFFDEDARKKLRKEKIKQCIPNIIVAGIAGGCIMSIPVLACSACWYPCVGGNGACFCYRAGGLFFESAVVGFGTGCCVSTPSFALTFACEIHEKMKPDNFFEHKLDIPQEILKTADAKKTYWLKKELLGPFLTSQSVKNRYDMPNMIPQLFSCTYIPEKRILATLQERLKQKNHIRPFVADKFFREYKLPKDVIKYLFKFIDFSEFDQLAYITERELFYMLQNTTYNTNLPFLVLTYKNQILLAKNGWISFCKTEKYPLKCETKYFDHTKLPTVASLMYCASEGPTIYLPFSLELAHYYQFEKDPAYETEYSHPSNEQIRALLAEREKISPRQQITSLQNSNLRKT